MKVPDHEFKPIVGGYQKGDPRFSKEELERTEEKLARHTREMEALYETSLEINAQPDLPSLLSTIVERAANLLSTHMGGLYLTEPDGKAIRLTVGYNLPEQFIGTKLDYGEGLSGRIAQSGEPLMVEDYREWEGRAPVYEGSIFRLVLDVPLKIGEKPRRHQRFR
jgi:GAF domain-containing protein